MILLSPAEIRVMREKAVIFAAQKAYFAEAPIEMSLLQFEIGWQEKDRQYAVIGLAAL